jgi:hypothetical protein
MDDAAAIAVLCLRQESKAHVALVWFLPDWTHEADEAIVGDRLPALRPGIEDCALTLHA